METPKSLPEQVRRRLGEVDWEKILPQLVVVSVGMARRRYWRSPDSDFLAKGMSPEDVLHECLRKVYEGTLSWDPEKYPDILRFMKESALPSYYAKLVRSKDNTLVGPFKDDPNNPNGLIEPIPASPDLKHAAHIVRVERNQEETLIEQEESTEKSRRAKALIDRLLEATQGDATITAILEAGMEGITKPQTIAERANIPIKDIYNAQKKLRRIHKKICDDIALPSFSGAIP